MLIAPSGHVLVRAAVTQDGRCVVVAPGVEIPVAAVDIVTDMPRPPAGMPATAILFFETEDDRDDFAETFRDWPGIEARAI